MKNQKVNQNSKLNKLKKELDSLEIEERLEMVKITDMVAEGCCCFCNEGCNGTC